MPGKLLFSLLALASTSPLVLGKFNLEGCTSMTTVNEYDNRIILYYLPDTGEVCDIPDCGGGRAPPKYDEPACPAYTGTETYSPSFIDLPTPTPSPSSSIPASTTKGAGTTLQTSTTDVDSPPVTTRSTTYKASMPSGTGIMTITPGINTTVSTSPPVATQSTDGAVGLGVSAGMMAGLIAAIGFIAL